MTTREQLQASLAALAAQLDRLDTYPEQDPYRDGQAVRFKWQSPTSGRAFTYLALRAGGKWYTTGRESHLARPWSSLVDWLVTGKVTTLELLVPQAKYDRKLAKARAAAQLAATQFNSNVRTPPPAAADPVMVKDLFEDLMALQSIERPLSAADAAIGGVIPTPIIDRLLNCGKAPAGSPEHLAFLAAIARYETVMDSYRRDRGVAPQRH